MVPSAQVADPIGVAGAATVVGLLSNPMNAESIMNISLSSYVVLFSNGSIDHSATLEKFAGDLAKFEAERELESSTIGAVLHALFDKHMGKRIPTPFVISECLKELNAVPENYKTLSEKVTDFIKVSPDFVTTRGKGGGVARIADMND